MPRRASPTSSKSCDSIGSSMSRRDELHPTPFAGRGERKLESRHPCDVVRANHSRSNTRGRDSVDPFETPSVTCTSRSGHLIRNVAVVGLGLVLGLGFALGPRLSIDADASKRDTPLPSGAVPLGSLSTRLVADAAASAGDAVASASLELDPPAAPAPSASAAIEAFLAAEIGGRFDISYGLLGAADRTRAGGRAWIANHANLPPMTGFAVESVARVRRRSRRRDCDGPALVAGRDRRSRTRARPRVAGSSVREDGGWRVGLLPQPPRAPVSAPTRSPSTRRASG